jgi:hypothetical protein
MNGQYFSPFDVPGTGDKPFQIIHRGLGNKEPRYGGEQYPAFKHIRMAYPVQGSQGRVGNITPGGEPEDVLIPGGGISIYPEIVRQYAGFRVLSEDSAPGQIHISNILLKNRIPAVKYLYNREGTGFLGLRPVYSA